MTSFFLRPPCRIFSAIIFSIFVNPFVVSAAPHKNVQFDAFWNEILSRDLKGKVFQTLLNSKKLEDRILVAKGLGVLRDVSTLPTLIDLLKSGDSKIQKETSFAIGQFGWLKTFEKDPHYESTLKELVSYAEKIKLDISAAKNKKSKVKVFNLEKDLTIVIDSISKVAYTKAPEILNQFLSHSSALIREHAIFGFFRYRQVLKSIGRESEIKELSESEFKLFEQLSTDQNSGIRRAVSYFFSRFSQKNSEALLLKLAQDTNDETKVFSLGALTKLKSQTVKPIAYNLLKEKSSIVKVAALNAIAGFSTELLEKDFLFNDPSFHVRNAFFQNLSNFDEKDVGTFFPEASEVRTRLKNLVLKCISDDESFNVKITCKKLLIKISKAEEQSKIVKEMGEHENWLVREAAISVSDKLELNEREAFLIVKLKDQSLNVRSAGLEALGKIETQSAFEQILKFGTAAESKEQIRDLKKMSVAELSAKITALKERKEPEAIDEIFKLYELIKTPKWVEVRDEIVDHFLKLNTEKSKSFLGKIANDPDASVRTKISLALRANTEASSETKTEAKTETKAESKTETKTEATPTGPYYKNFISKKIRARLSTNRGKFEFELFPDSAPYHVSNFVAYAKKGFYNGLSWHRVVSNFVIQGGDPEGTGYGSDGYTVKAEFNSREFKKGALGMPRAQGHDTGGCQLFFSLLSTPHLESQYTVFGQIDKGLDVIEKIERGDIIQKIEIL